MVNTADAGRRAYGNERNHGRRNRRKLSSVMAMVLGALVTIEIMIMGAMLFESRLSFGGQDCSGSWFYGIILGSGSCFD